VDIFTNEEKDVVTVPIQSVTAREIKDEKKKKTTNKNDQDANEEKEYKEVVFVFSQDSVSMVEVTTGIQDDEYIQILNGIDDDMEIVSGPYSAISEKLDDGKAVYLKVDKEKKKDSKEEE